MVCSNSHFVDLISHLDRVSGMVHFVIWVFNVYYVIVLLVVLVYAVMGFS